MAYFLYTDKPNKFNCNVEIEGTSLAKSKVRLVVETNEMTYMFNGRIENNGLCEVSIPKTKHFLPEGTVGLMKLEVIADDVYFEPWSSEFGVKTNKKVNVVVEEQQIEEKPKLKVEVFQPIEKEPVKEEVKKEVVKKPIVTKVEPKKKPVQESKEIVLTKNDLFKILKQRGLK